MAENCTDLEEIAEKLVHFFLLTQYGVEKII